MLCTTGSSGSLSCGVREVKSPYEWRGGACHCSRVMVVESGLNAMKKDARGLSRVVEFSRLRYWGGLTFPSPGDLPDPGV